MPIRVTLPLQGNATVTIEGEIEYVKSTIGQMKELMELLGTEVGVLSATPPITVTKPMSTLPSKEGPPVIPAEKKSSLTEAIISLFETDWALKPRSFSEIKDALAANAIYRDKGALAGTLFSLVEQNKIRRHKDPHLNMWVYTKY